MDASALKWSESRSVMSDALRPCGLYRPCWSVLNGQLTSSFCPAQGAQLSRGSLGRTAVCRGTDAGKRSSPETITAWFIHCTQYKRESLTTNKKSEKQEKQKQQVSRTFVKRESGGD